MSRLATSWRSRSPASALCATGSSLKHRSRGMPALYQDHRRQIEVILLAWGMPADRAAITADVMSYADLHGIDSHGMSLLPGYDERRRKGQTQIQAVPTIVRETPVSALVDGGGG